MRVLWVLSLMLLCTLARAESLHYEASYKGPFSAGKHLPIAAVQLDSEYKALPSGEKVLQTTMHVTSKPYDFVEEHFPFRVRYRSLYAPGRKHMLAVEKYEKTSRIKHEISWVDVEQHQRCQPWRAKRRLVDPSSREAALFSRRALRQRENKVGIRTRRPVIWEPSTEQQRACEVVAQCLVTRTAGAQIGCQRPSRFWGLGCPKIYHEAEDTLVAAVPSQGQECGATAVSGIVAKLAGAR